MTVAPNQIGEQLYAILPETFIKLPIEDALVSANGYSFEVMIEKQVFQISVREVLPEEGT